MWGETPVNNLSLKCLFLFSLTGRFLSANSLFQEDKKIMGKCAILQIGIWTAVNRNKNCICSGIIGEANLKIVCTDGNFAYESEL